MSISALSSSLISDLSQSQNQNPFRQLRQDFRELASALQSGDLSGAQSAFSNIQQLLQGQQGSSTSSTTQNDFAALGQALQSGSLSQAQSAFSQLQSDLQAGPAAGQAPPQAADRYQAQNPVEEAIQDYSQLASSLQNGDLTDAQSAYTNLQQLVQANQGASSDSTNAVQTDFATLGQDLQSGNLTQAQSDFAQLQSDLQAPTQSATASSDTTQASTLSPAQQVQQDYAELSSALGSGNLTSAQSAFTALEQALQTQSGSTTSTASSTTSSSSDDPIANDLTALGKALSSGDLTQAQSAFSQLQSDLNTAQQSAASQSQNSEQGQRTEGRHHHHRWGSGDGNSGSTVTAFG
jgi:outer membrane protein assembly factor BamD (BamD/ComL family)